MELGWWKRDDEGRKYQVRVELFGKRLRWRCQRQRFEPWTDYASPTDDDWSTALKLAENRYQRRLVDKRVVDLVRRRGSA